MPPAAILIGLVTLHHARIPNDSNVKATICSKYKQFLNLNFQNINFYINLFITKVTKQLAVLNKSSQDDLLLLKEAMGIMQHHDAITGTEKQHVTDDYVRLLTKAIRRAEGHIDAAIQ